MAQKKNAAKAAKPAAQAKVKPARKAKRAVAQVNDAAAVTTVAKAQPAAQPKKIESVPAKAAAPRNTRPAPVKAAAVRKTRPAAPQAKPVKAAAEATAATANQINERTTQMQNEATRIANENAQAMFGDINERAKNGMERSTRVMEEMTDLARGNVEAIVASSKVAARGVETLSQEAAEFSRKSFEEASAAFRTFSEVRSPTDFFRLQSDFAKTQFDSLVAESSKLSEAMIKLAGEVAEPITSRYSAAAERVKNLAA